MKRIFFTNRYSVNVLLISMLLCNIICVRKRDTATAVNSLGPIFAPTLQCTFPMCVLANIRSEFSPSVVSDSLQPYESQHARPPCPSPTPGVHSDSRPSSRWCHPARCTCMPSVLKLLPHPTPLGWYRAPFPSSKFRGRWKKQRVFDTIHCTFTCQ